MPTTTESGPVQLRTRRRCKAWSRPKKSHARWTRHGGPDNLNGDATSITYPDGNSLTRTFDDDSRLASVTDWNGSTSSFSYDADGNNSLITYGNGVTETTTRNQADETTLLADAKGATSLASYSYSRDPMGQLMGSVPTGSTGQTHETYGHTTLDQLSTYNTATTTGSYNYDSADNLTGFPDGTTQVFDPANQLTGRTGSSGTYTYGYNSLGDRIRATGTDGTTNFGYDQANRLTTYTGPGGATNATYGYNGDGLRTTKTVNGVTSPFTWDTKTGSVPLLLSDGATDYVYGPGGTPIEQLQAPNISFVGSSAANDPGPTDPLTINLPPGVKAGDVIVVGISEDVGQYVTANGYQYLNYFADSSTTAGERLELLWHVAAGAETTVSLTSASSLSVHPRAALALVYRGVDTTHAVGGAINGTSQMINSLTVPATTAATVGERAVFVGGSLNDPTNPSWTLPANTISRASSSAAALANVVASDQQLTSKGNVHSRFATLNTSVTNLDSMAGTSFTLRPQTTQYLLHDQQGSTRLLTSPNGTVVGTYHYGPYGNTAGHTGLASSALLYNGQYQDAETGLYYLRARYYDPTTAQFLTKDPLQALTRRAYQYANNSPFDMSDPSGLSAGNAAGGAPGSGCDKGLPLGFTSIAAYLGYQRLEWAQEDASLRQMENVLREISQADQLLKSLQRQIEASELLLNYYTFLEDEAELHAGLAGAIYSATGPVVGLVGGCYAGAVLGAQISPVAAEYASVLTPAAGVFAGVGTVVVGCIIGGITDTQLPGPDNPIS